MKPFSALYCRRTQTLLESQMTGGAVRTPANPGEVEFWYHKGAWIYLLYNQNLYEEVKDEDVPAVVRLARMVSQ